MHFSFYIAKRYIFSKSRNNAINIITKIASSGIIVGAMALFIVLSVFSGLREFSLSFSNDFDPDLKVIPSIGKSFYISAEQEKKLKKTKGIAIYSKIIEERVLFSFDNKQLVTYLKGVDANYEAINKASQKLFNGQWLKPNTYQVVIGYGVSNKLSLGLFDFSSPFEVFVPKPGKGAIENPNEAFNKEILAPVGIYAINEELDSKYVFADLGLVQELLEFKTNQVSGIEIKTNQEVEEEVIIKNIEEILNSVSTKITVKNRAQLNDTLHKMLNTENVAIYLIFTLVIIIALFNLIGALIMMILEKKANLKTLLNLGSDVKNLRKIFLIQGTLVSLIGGIVGLILGGIVIGIQQQFQLIMITPSLPYPVVFEIQNVIIVLLTIVTLGFIASLIASNRVSKKFLN